MLHDFLTVNRNELIARCRETAARRFEPSAIPPAADHGVPLFLQQLVETLRAEHSGPAQPSAPPAGAPLMLEISRAASSHGAELLRRGYSVAQVVRSYGDVCQAITSLAVEQQELISAEEFRTLNRCLDDAIADAVTAFGRGRQVSTDLRAEDLRQRLSSFSSEQRRLVDIALHAYSAIRTGNIGVTGATGTLLVHTLTELGAHAERALSELPLAGAVIPAALGA